MPFSSNRHFVKNVKVVFKTAPSFKTYGHYQPLPLATNIKLFSVLFYTNLVLLKFCNYSVFRDNYLGI